MTGYMTPPLRRARVQSLHPPSQNEGNRLLTPRSDFNYDTEVKIQLDINHLLLGLAWLRGMKRSMDVLEREIKRMKEQTPAVDRKSVITNKIPWWAFES